MKEHLRPGEGVCMYFKEGEQVSASERQQVAYARVLEKDVAPASLKHLLSISRARKYFSSIVYF